MHNPTWDPDLFGQILGQVCDEADLSQADLARLSGKSQSTVSRWTNSRNQPTYDGISRLATAVTTQHPKLANLVRKLVAAAGYSDQITGSMSAELPALSGSMTGRSEAAHKVLDDLRAQALAENRTLAEVLVDEGLAHPEELVVPDSLPPDPIIEEINASDISEETKLKLIRIHLDNRARRFEEARLERKKPDGRV